MMQGPPIFQVIILTAAFVIIVTSICIVLINVFSGDSHDIDLRDDAHRPKSKFPK